jgi:hypothetical protein
VGDFAYWLWRWFGWSWAWRSHAIHLDRKNRERIRARMAQIDNAELAELRRRRRDEAFNTWMLAIAISIIAVFALSHDWKGSLIAWICGGGFLSTYESWRKLRG